MKTGHKVAALALSLALTATATAFGTMAYLTAHTGEVTNTFTVGNVALTLDEAKVKLYGEKEVNKDGAVERITTGNEYKLLPGHTYVKDPTVHIAANSEEAYIRMKVKVEQIDALKAAFPKDKNPDYYAGDVFLLEKLVSGWDSTKWISSGYAENTVNDGTTSKQVGEYEFRYYEKRGTVDAAAADLEPLFTEITVPDSADADTLKELEKVKIVVTAEAIQADGFTDADDAWKNFTPQGN